MRRGAQASHARPPLSAVIAEIRCGADVSRRGSTIRTTSDRRRGGKSPARAAKRCPERLRRHRTAHAGTSEYLLMRAMLAGCFVAARPRSQRGARRVTALAACVAMRRGERRQRAPGRCCLPSRLPVSVQCAERQQRARSDVARAVPPRRCATAVRVIMMPKSAKDMLPRCTERRAPGGYI